MPGQKRQNPREGVLTVGAVPTIFPSGGDGVDSVVWCTTTVKHRLPSAVLVGETTRRISLNLDRGSQPLGTRRIARKREWHRATGKSSSQQGGSVSHRISARLGLGVLRLNRAEFTISHQS